MFGLGNLCVYALSLPVGPVNKKLFKSLYKDYMKLLNLLAPTLASSQLVVLHPIAKDPKVTMDPQICFHFSHQ